MRADAEDGLARLAAALDKLTAGGDADAARANADDTLAILEQLRRLFLNIAEHLQALHAEQAQTHDQTATTQFESTVDKLDTLPAELGSLAERQARHTALGEQLAAALAGQADAAASADAAGAPNGEQIGQAADEVRQAAARMTSAATMLADAAAKAGAMSPELEPTLADQTAAMEHLENALRALAPPNQRPDGEQGEEQQGEQQAEGQEQDGQSEEERMSQRQALKRLQAIRDRETERQRRRQAADAGREPVEKDW